MRYSTEKEGEGNPSVKPTLLTLALMFAPFPAFPHFPPTPDTVWHPKSTDQEWTHTCPGHEYQPSTSFEQAILLNVPCSSLQLVPK